MKKILVINLGWEQEPLLDKLEEYDIDIFGVHYNHNYYKSPKYKDILVCGIRDLEKILNFAKKNKIEAVISDQCDYSYFAQSLIAESLNLSGPKIKEAQISTNKYLQRIKAKKSGILIPNFSLCCSIDDIYDFAKTNGYPIIIKPIDNRGSFGVNKINNIDEILLAYENSLINSHSRLIIVEDFINGKHITVDGYIFKDKGVKSLAIADKILASKERQVAIEIQYPANFDTKVYNKILKTNEYVNRSLGFHFGMIHSEYMVTKNNDIYLIESANRGGGVYTSEIIVPNVSGINILDQYICDTLNIKKSFFNDKIQKNRVVLKFFNLKSGKIKDIIGLESISRMSEILKFRLLVKKSDVIEDITTDGNRHGFLIAKNESIDINEEIKKHIKIYYEK